MRQKTLCYVALIVIVGIFYGDVWIGITVPLALILSLALLPSIDFRSTRFPLGAWLLAGLFLVVGVQSALGMPPRYRSDLIVYLPILYAGWFIFVFSRIYVTPRLLCSSIISGAMLSGILMVGNMMFAPPDFMWVRSQEVPTIAQIIDENFVQADGSETGSVQNNGQRGSRGQLDSRSIAPATSEENMKFYERKWGARNALGFSNYLSVFFVFAFTIAIFRLQYVPAFILSLFAISAQSRFGYIFLFASFVVWAASRFIPLRYALAALVFSVGASMATLIWLSSVIEQLPQMASLTARIAYWEGGMSLVGFDNILGMPRSYLAYDIGALVYWNPHNSLLWLWALFGVGSILYWGYVAATVHSIEKASAIDSSWKGVLVAIVVTLAWSLVEPINLTPAFEIILAVVYATTWRQLNSQGSLEGRPIV